MKPKLRNLGERDNHIQNLQKEKEKLLKNQKNQISDLNTKRNTNSFIDKVINEQDEITQNKLDEKTETIARLQTLLTYINSVIDSGLVSNENRKTALLEERKRIQKEIKQLEK